MVSDRLGASGASKAGGGHQRVRSRQRHGSRSLGVITFNQIQQFAVLDELIELRKNRPDMEPFFREDRPEPFFVKNLENVQGDERDRIILSVAYGLNEETGRDSMSFGPLNRAGCERRLNVAVTRSRDPAGVLRAQCLESTGRFSGGEVFTAGGRGSCRKMATDSATGFHEGVTPGG